MKTGRYFIIFAILTLAQALISNYFLFSQYILISLLPKQFQTIIIRNTDWN